MHTPIYKALRELWLHSLRAPLQLTDSQLEDLLDCSTKESSDIEVLKEEIDDLEDEVSELKGDIDDLKDEVRDLKDEVRDAKQSRDSAHDRVLSTHVHVLTTPNCVDYAKMVVGELLEKGASISMATKVEVSSPYRFRYTVRIETREVLEKTVDLTERAQGKVTRTRVRASELSKHIKGL